MYTSSFAGFSFTEVTVTLYPSSVSVTRTFPANSAIGDSDFGATYSKEPTCLLEYDINNETGDDVVSFDREIERPCCSLDFWKVLEVDDELKKKFDLEMNEIGDNCNFDESYDFFRERYNIKKFITINEYVIASICNNLNNYKDYYINEIGKCYYKDEYIGDIDEKINNDTVDIYFKPNKPVKYVTVNFKIEKN